MSFRDWQPLYAAHGIATFPVVVGPNGKKPMVSNYAKFGLPASAEIAEKFPDATGIGFMVGARNRLTVLDVDSPDDRILADALNRHGPTPIIVRSGSGHFQGWYQHGGERKRLIRPEPDKPIDILSGGFVVAPPSHGTKTKYQFITGSLDDLDHLPHLRGLPAHVDSRAETTAPHSTDRIREGVRNKTLWEHCMRHAPHCDGFNDLLDVAWTQNAEFLPPLLDDEVVKVAMSAWGYTERGENWFGFGRRVALPHATVDRLAAQHPNALALLSILKRLHGGRDEFVLAKETADKLGWSLPAFRSARKRLEDEGEIRCISHGGRGAHDPPRYAWK